MSFRAVAAHRGARVGLVAAAAALAGAGVTYAAVPSSATGRINACYATSGTKAGLLRVIDAQAGQKCATGEKSVAWQANGIRYMRSYSSASTYSAGDVVSYLGSSFIALTTNTGVAPVAGTRWAVFAAKGATGAAGPKGATGATGATGPQGPSGDAAPQHGRMIIRPVVTGVTGGNFASMVVPPGGQAYIAYVTSGNVVGIATCTSADCSTTGFRTVANVSPDAAFDPSIAIGNNGNPVVAFVDGTTSQILLALCNDAMCASAKTFRTIDTAPLAGSHVSNSVNIGSDGLPVLAYSSSGVVLAHCTSANCSSFTKSTIVSFTVPLGASAFPSLTVGTNGMPVVAYYDLATLDLKIAFCNDLGCTAPTIRTLDSTGDVGAGASLALASNGFPVVSYVDRTTNVVKLAMCSDAGCSSAPVIRTLTPAGTFHDATSLAIRPDGAPFVATHNSSVDHLELLQCADPACTSNSVDIADTSTSNGATLSAGIGPDGTTRVAYWDAVGTPQLKVAIVGHTSWTPNGWGH